MLKTNTRPGSEQVRGTRLARRVRVRTHAAGVGGLEFTNLARSLCCLEALGGLIAHAR